MPVQVSGLDGAPPLFGLSESLPMPPVLTGLKPPLATLLSGIQFDEEGDAVAH